MNSAYQTPLSSRSIQIDSTIDLSDQIVHLLSPVPFDTTNQNTIQFRWSPLYNATSYQLILKKAGIPILISESENNMLSHTIEDGDGAYQWCVQGLNETSSTQWSCAGLYIDQTPPPAPVLLTPPDHAVAKDSLILFSWNQPTDEGSHIFDSLFIASDTAFKNIIHSVHCETTHWADSLGTGNYYWKVKGYDTAGNEGQTSEVFNLRIQ